MLFSSHIIVRTIIPGKHKQRASFGSCAWVSTFSYGDTCRISLHLRVHLRLYLHLHLHLRLYLHLHLHLRLHLRLTTMPCSKHGLLQTDRNLWKRMLKTGCHFCLCSKVSAKAGKIHVVTWHSLTVLANSGSSGLEGECQKSMWTGRAKQHQAMASFVCERLFSRMF